MHEEILEQKTKLVFGKIGKIRITTNFYLAGGTGLALQFGHRKSLDLDFFSKNKISVRDLKKELRKLGVLRIISEQEDTLNCILDGVKISFFEYPYRVLFPFVRYNKIKIANFKDIACMKLDAISSRGSKKDFVDLYFFLEKLSLKKLLILFDRKYQEIKYNRLHLLKSLSYFEEAEKEPMPKMLLDVSWNDIKKEIIKKVAEKTRE